MTNKLIEFLLDPESKGLILGNNGFRAERPTSTFVGIWYEGKVICKIEPDFIQHAVTVLPPDSADVCDRLTELLHLLGMPSLRVKWFGKRAYIQRMRDGLPVAEYALREPYTLRVTI